MTFLEELGITRECSGAYAGEWLDTRGKVLESTNPATGEVIGRIRQATAEDHDRCVAAAHEAFLRWREVPAPRRGEIVRRMTDAIRAKKDPLGRLITLENGKIHQEG
jgi:acyl-CoA reductase-like NAD-dependent aldehyde dehydrogenase